MKFIPKYLSLAAGPLSLTTPQTLTPEQAQQILANAGIPTISIVSYGADPTGAVDATASINSAELNAALSGKDLLIPNGIFSVNDKITKYGGVNWYGPGTIEGKGATQGTVNMTATSGNASVTYTAGTTDLVGASIANYVTGRTLQLPGSATIFTITAHNSGTRTLTLSPAADVTFSAQPVTIKYTRPVVYASSVNDWSIKDMHIKNVLTDTPNVFTPNSGGTGNTLNACIVAKNCKRWQVNGCRFENYSYGLFYSGAENAIIANNILRTGNTHTVDEIFAGTYIHPWTYSMGGGIISDTLDGNPTPQSYSVVINANVIDNMGADVGINVGTQLWGENPTIVSNNIIRGGNSGIQAYMGSIADPTGEYTIKRITQITGNHISYTMQTGIYLRQQQGCLVTGNYLWKTQLGALNYNSGNQFGAIVTRVSPYDTDGTAGVINSPVSFELGHIIHDNIIIDTGNPNAGIDMGGLTASTTSGSTSITVSAGTYLAPSGSGQQIQIAGVSGVKTIVTVSGLNLTLDVACNATVSNAVVTAYKPGGEAGIQIRTEGCSVRNNVISQSDELFGFRSYKMLQGIYVASNVASFQIANNRIRNVDTAIVVNRTSYFQTLPGITATTVSGSTSITVNKAYFLFPGQEIAIASLSNWVFTVQSISGTTVVLDIAPNATVTNQKVSQLGDAQNNIESNAIDCVKTGIALADGYLTGCTIGRNQIQRFTNRAISIRRSQNTRILDNLIEDGAAGSYGIYNDGITFKSDFWGGSARLGATVTCTGNRINRVPTPHYAANTSGADASFMARCIEWDDIVDGVHVGRELGTAAPTASGNQLTWTRGQKQFRSNAAASGYVGSVCITSGTFGTLSGVTASTTSGSAAITLNAAGGIAIGDYITITGVSGTFQVIDVNGTNATLSANAGATVSAAAVALSAPVFKDFGAITA